MQGMLEESHLLIKYEFQFDDIQESQSFKKAIAVWHVYDSL